LYDPDADVLPELTAPLAVPVDGSHAPDADDRPVPTVPPAAPVSVL
jgi:hypothetical protein